MNEQGIAIHVAAHSHGNILASEALRLGVKIDNYIMMQAALPAAMFNTSDTLNDPELHPHALKYYDPNALDEDNIESGYLGFFRNVHLNVTGRMFNFYNPEDFALQSGVLGFETFSWRGNMLTLKPVGTPQALGNDFFYTYAKSEPEGDRYLIRVAENPSRIVTDPHEVLAFICPSSTKAVGAESRTFKSENSFNLQEKLGFTGSTSDHSGQFNRSIQQLWEFYEAILGADRKFFFVNKQTGHT